MERQESQAKADSGGVQPAKLIIQCPSCQTRFSVAKSAVAGLDSLRFHCSKCDNVFSKAVSELQLATPKAADGDKAILTPQKVAQEIVKEVVPAPVEISAKVQTTTAQPTAIRNFSEPTTSTVSAPSTPLESQPTVSTPKAEVSAFDFQDNFKFDDSTYQTSFKFPENRPSSPPTKAGVNLSHSFSTEPGSRSAVSNAPKLSSSRESEPGFSDDWQLGDRYILTKHSGFSGFALLVAPIVAFLILLGGIGLYLASHPQFTQDLLLSAIPSLPVAPPDGLHIENASFETIKLENGEEVRIVSGKITNGTALAFEDVKVEAHAFDKSGNIIDRATIGSGSSLAETRVKSLSREMISELQSEQTRDKTTLGPGESREFSVALLDRAVSKAAFFSARIYSVRQNEL